MLMTCCLHCGMAGFFEQNWKKEKLVARKRVSVRHDWGISDGAIYCWPVTSALPSVGLSHTFRITFFWWFSG